MVVTLTDDNDNNDNDGTDVDGGNNVGFDGMENENNDKAKDYDNDMDYDNDKDYDTETVASGKTLQKIYQCPPCQRTFLSASYLQVSKCQSVSNTVSLSVPPHFQDSN